jgi:hypothetical protein
MSCDQPAEKQVLLRSFAGVTLLFGIGELIVDLVVYRDHASPKVGAWWAAIIILVSGVLGLISTSRGVVIATCVVSIIAVIVGVIGCAVDGIANTVVTSLEACVSYPEGTVSGDSSYTNTVENSCSFYTDQCCCVTNDNAVFFYRGGIVNNDNCQNILGEYTQALHGSIALDLLATFAVFALSIVTCISVCCPGYGGGSGNVTTMSTPGANVAAGTITSPVFVQPAYPPQGALPQQFAQPGYYPPQGYPPQQGYPSQQGYPPQGYAGQPAIAQGVVVDGKKY